MIDIPVGLSNHHVHMTREVAYEIFGEGYELTCKRELLQKGYPKKDLHIIGLAKDYEEALHMTTAIVDETYQATGTVDIYHYLMNKRREDK